MPKLLFLSGSKRQGSLNTKLAKAAKKVAEEHGATTEYIDFNDYEMPLFCEDYEAKHGVPETAIALKKKFIEADGFFISCPEYNSSITPLLKNALDWMSRPHEKDEPILAAYNDKAAAIGAVSPGGLGGMRTLVPLRLLLANVNVNVVGRQISVAKGHEAFDENGDIKNDSTNKMLQSIIKQLIRISA